MEEVVFSFGTGSRASGLSKKLSSYVDGKSGVRNYVSICFGRPEKSDGSEVSRTCSQANGKWHGGSRGGERCSLRRTDRQLRRQLRRQRGIVWLSNFVQLCFLKLQCSEVFSIFRDLRGVNKSSTLPEVSVFFARSRRLFCGFSSFLYHIVFSFSCSFSCSFSALLIAGNISRTYEIICKHWKGP